MKRVFLFFLILLFFPIFVSATTERFYSTSNTDDACVYRTDITWPVAHDTELGENKTDTNLMNSWAYFSSPTYYIKRCFHFFNTSALPDDAVINSASFNFYIYQIQGSANYVFFNIYKNTGSRPAMADAMYNKGATTTPYSTDRAVSSFTQSTWDKYDLNTSGLTDINKTGYTGLALLQYTNDVLNVATTSPVNRNFVIYSFNQTGTSSDPYLSITYNENTYPQIIATTTMILENIILNSTTTAITASTTLTEANYTIPFFLYFLVLSGLSFTILFVWFSHYMIYPRKK